MIIAIMESETKSWYAKGKSEKEAKQNILNKWNENQDLLEKYDKAHGIIDDYYKYATIEELENNYDIRTINFANENCVVW